MYGKRIIFALEIIICDTKIVIFIQKQNILSENFRKMTFRDYMNGLSTKAVSEKATMITRIAEAVCRHENTVYAWISGRTAPNDLERKTISGLLNRPEEELFPNVKK